MSEIRLETDDNQLIRIIGDAHRVALRELKDAIEDIADRIEAEARDRAPLGETGELREHPTERLQSSVGIVTSLPLFGGGSAIRGPSGRFVPGIGAAAGDLIARVEIGLPQEPKHAIWVHEGTGIYGPRKTPIRPLRAPYLRFTIDGREYRRKFVRGQHPNPYLFEAYLFVNNTYVPARIALLRAELSVLS